MTITDELKKVKKQELLPCPFCGNGAQAEYSPRPRERLLNAPWQVRCFTCGTRGKRGSSKESAEEGWNTRIAQVEALEAAKAGVDEVARCRFLLTRIAIAIERADNDPAPAGTEIDVPEVSDWGEHLAKSVMQVVRPYLRPTPDLDSPELREVVAKAIVSSSRRNGCEVYCEGAVATAALSAIKAHLQGKE